MTRGARWLIAVFGVVAAGAAVLGAAMSHNTACPQLVPHSPGPTTMKALVHRCYGDPGVLRLENIARPAVGDSDVLVRVRAAALNPVDWHYLRGTPYLMRLGSGLGAPKEPRLGVDFAGTVEAVGKDVTRFVPGDEVFGGGHGSLAEFVAVKESRGVVKKPARLSFVQAAAVGVAAVTALQGLRDQGLVAPGQKVLINGASGGVGTFAVQLARSLGAEVTGVCSARNAELVRSLGAAHVVDYARDDFTRSGTRYDLIVDNVGNRSLSDLRRALTPNGRAILIGGGGPDRGNWIGPLALPLKALLLSPFVSQTLRMFIAEVNRADLEALAELMQSGAVTPVVDREYPITEAAAAMRYLEEGHARGKVVVTIP